MKKLEIFYGLATVGALGFGFGLPFLVHRGGTDAPPGWIEFVTPGPLSDAHAFIGNDCAACHTPHTGVATQKCVSCHANSEHLLSTPATAFHATVGSCTGCHIEHDPQGVAVSRMDHGLLVAIARDAGLAGDGTNDATWMTRSLIHARLAGRPHERATIAEMTLDCAKCHASEEPHRTLFGSDCLSCHSTTTWTVPEFVHPSPRSMDCAQCHVAPPSHYMGHFNMVSKRVAGIEHADVTQCFLCHRTNSWNEIPKVGWYKHH